MGATADVVVVGGGVMGCAIALELVQRGAGRVCLLEKKHLAAGSSGKSGAILRQHYSHVETIRMAREGLAFYRDFAAQYGRDIGFVQSGMVFLVDARDRVTLQRHVAMQQDEGVPTRVVDHHELAVIEPRGFYETDCLGAFEEDSATVDPRRAVEALAVAAHEAGAMLSLGEGLTGLRADERRVQGVDTTHGSIDCGHVVLATGPWSVALVRDQLRWDLPLRVVRPQQAFLEPPADFGDPIPIFADLRLGSYWKAEGPRHTRVGDLGTAHDRAVEDPDDYDEGVSHAFLQQQKNVVARRLPGYARATLWGGVGALYTMTPDSHPVIGAPPRLGGFTLVTGFSGHGFKLAPAVARGVAQRILHDDDSRLAPTLFSPERFGQERPAAPGYRFGILG
jgi:glycine/D-amino acid oxidase-like deaminating enzyme